MIYYLIENVGRLSEALIQHVQLFVFSLVISILITIVCTIVACYQKRFILILTSIFAMLYTIPSIAMLAFFLPFTGLGSKTAILVLVIYNLYALLSNTLFGLFQIEEQQIECATALGYTPLQMLWYIRLPQAKHSILTGIRLASISSIQIATIAALINAGGLGSILFEGLRTLNINKIICGSVLSAALAMLVHTGIMYLDSRWEVRR